MATKNLSAIRAVVRQFLNDEFVSGTEYEFKDDELNLYIGKILGKVSQRRPYQVKETVVSDGTREVDLSDIEDLLLPDSIVKVEYPTGNEPPTFCDFSIFGSTLRFDDVTPTSGENIYLYCEKVHQLTETVSECTLTSVMEDVLIEGAIASAAQSWCNRMRNQIVPQSYNWHKAWANEQFLIYQNSLDDITPQKEWEF